MRARLGLIATVVFVGAVAAYLAIRLIGANAPLATSSPGAFVRGCPAALLEGLLVADAGSGTAVEVGLEKMPVVWPFGYTGHRTTDGGVEVRDVIGAVIARTGEHVSLSGGMITADGRWSTCGPPLARS